MIFVALVVLSAWLPASSYASFPATSTNGCPSGTCTNYSFPDSGWQSSVQAAADAQVVYMTNSSRYGGVGAGGQRTYRLGYLSGLNAGFDMYGGSGAWNVNWYSWTATVQSVVPAYSCPASATLSGAVCTCTSGFTESGSACVSKADSTCERLNSSKAVLTGMGTGLTLCLDGVTVKASGAAIGMKGGVNTGGNFFGPFSCPGTPCSGSPTAGEPVGAKDCKVTEIWVTMPGGGICVGADILKDKGPSETVDPSPDGTPPGPGIPGAPPGTTSSSKETTCASGSCTTTTTYKDAAGNVLGTHTETQPQPSFCQENPASPVCVKSSVSVSACGTPDACTGDAVQCAINAQSKATTCALTTPPVDDSNIKAFNIAAAQDQGDQTGGMTSTVNIGASSFDQTDLLGPRVDLVDQVVTVAGTSVTIPWSKASEKLRLIGLIMQAVTFLVCARIVMRG
ncbi:MAG: hypothetical protein WA136_04145 [Rhodoferax sp.]